MIKWRSSSSSKDDGVGYFKYSAGTNKQWDCTDASISYVSVINTPTLEMRLYSYFIIHIIIIIIHCLVIFTMNSPLLPINDLAQRYRWNMFKSNCFYINLCIFKCLLKEQKEAKQKKKYNFLLFGQFQIWF